VVFAREISDNLTSLVKKLDEATLKNKSARMGSFVVFCNDEEGLDKKLKTLAKDKGLEKIILTTDNPSGPSGWSIAQGADVTVVLYTKRTVKANFAFKKGELKSKDIDAIVGDVAKILPPKKTSK
jgi:hypothetical protein